MEAIRRLGMKRHIVLAIIFLTLNAVDNILTHFLLAKGWYELNPIARYGLERNELGFWCVDMMLALVFVSLLLLLARDYPRHIHRAFIGLVIAMAGVCVFNGMGLF